MTKDSTQLQLCSICLKSYTDTQNIKINLNKISRAKTRKYRMKNITEWDQDRLKISEQTISELEDVEIGTIQNEIEIGKKI